MLEYLNENLMMFQLLFFAILAVNFIVFFVGGKKAEAIFNGLDESSIRYQEKGASGRSTKNLITTMCGASKALNINVTDKELCIKGIFFLFTYIGTKYDLTHRVALGNITNVSRDGKNVKLSFVSNKGEHNVVLTLKDTYGFVQAIKG